MSCMYLDKKHYQFIADSLDVICWKYASLCEFYNLKQSFRDFSSIEQEEKIVRFINKLQVWNLKAYDERYPSEADPEFFPDLVTDTKPIAWQDLNIAQLLKACLSVDYQNSDASDWEQSEFSKLLGLIILDCRIFLINQLDSYQAAEWTIE